MIRYAIVLEWSSEDEAWIATVPDLPGCMADGYDEREALININDAIVGWLEVNHSLGRPVPEVKFTLRSKTG